MVRQFLTLVRNAKKMREEVETELTDALKGFVIAKAVAGGQAIESALSLPSLSFSIETASRSIMGITVPVIKTKSFNEIKVMPYGLASVPPELDQAIIKFYTFMEKLLKLAEAEKTCALLAEEMEKTRRRVNALEYIMIPELKEIIQYIQMKLDENERAGLVRLMKVKLKINK